MAEWGQLNESTPFMKMMARARWDIDYFAKELLGITAHPGQDRLWDAILKRDSSGWRPRYMTICCSAGNRAGKTLGVAIAILHSVMFKHGSKPPNPLRPKEVERWGKLAYDWYHFAIAQEIAEHVYVAITSLLSGVHEGQEDGCPILDMLGPGVAAWDKKERGEYLWIRVHPQLGGGQIHFRTTGEKAIGSLGKNMNGVSFDEAGHEPNFEFIVNEVLHFRRASTGGQFFLISTPTEGLTAFADKWNEGDPEAPDKKRFSYSVRMSTRENVGFGITPWQFERILEEVPEELIPQNVDGMFLEGIHSFFSQQSVDRMFKADLWGEGVDSLPAAPGHKYANGVDPALTMDSCWGIVLRVDPKQRGSGVDCNFSRGRQTSPAIVALASNLHNSYSIKGTRCHTVIDATGFGGAVFADLLIIKPVRTVEFGGVLGKKLKLLNNLKRWIETDKLQFPRRGKWLVLRRQLLGYRLSDKNLKTDAVMALALAVYQLSLTPSGDGAGGSFDFFGTGPVVSTANRR